MDLFRVIPLNMTEIQTVRTGAPYIVRWFGLTFTLIGSSTLALNAIRLFLLWVGIVTQKLIRVKIDPAGSLLVAIIDPAGSLLAAKSDPPLQKVIRVQILVDSSLF